MMHETKVFESADTGTTTKTKSNSGFRPTRINTVIVLAAGRQDCQPFSNTRHEWIFSAAFQSASLLGMPLRINSEMHLNAFHLQA